MLYLTPMTDLNANLPQSIASIAQSLKALTPHQKGNMVCKLPKEVIERHRSSFYGRTEAGKESYNGTRCLLWTGRMHSNAGRGRRRYSTYGNFRYTYNGHQHDLKAHRASYIFTYGKIPPGLTLDHLCSNPRCVNPLHLEAVTFEINLARAIAKRRERMGDT